MSLGLSRNAVIDLIENNSWNNNSSPDNDSLRFCLIEEFVGHKNFFRPDGTSELIRLKSIYNEKLIPVSIHSGVFSIPNSDTSSNMYSTVFSVNGEHGEAYDSLLNVS